MRKAIPAALLIATWTTAASSAEKPSGKPETKVEPKSKLEFIPIPGGTFHLGCEPQDTHCGDDEKPGKLATAQPFWLAKTMASVTAYAKCVKAGACTVPNTGGQCTWQVDGKENDPIKCIDWKQATAFCGWIGGRLPTAEEWEFGAKGGESRIYPWGNNAPDPTKVCPDDKPCGMAARDAVLGEAWASKHGLLNMVGGASQWTSSNYSAASKEVRGGWWSSFAHDLRASLRHRFGVSEDWDDGLGVRCAM